MGHFSAALTLNGLKLPWRFADTSSACVGIHFDGTELAAVRLHLTDGKPCFDRVLRIEAGAAGGYGDPGRAAFQALLREDIVHKAQLVVSLDPEAYETNTCAIPVGVPAEELKEALRWQLRENLPFPCDEAIIDYVRLPANVTRASASGHAFVVAARRLAVNAIVEQFSQAGLRLSAVEIPELSQRNLLPADQDAIAGFVSFSGQTCLLTLQCKGELCFSRRMILPSRVGDGDIEPEHLADRIATNVSRSLEVFTRQSNAGEVASVTVGPQPHSALIARCLKEQTNLDVSLFDPADVVDGVPSWVRHSATADAGQPLPASNAVIVALGGAIREVTARPAGRLLRWGLRRHAGEAASLPGA